MYIKSIFTLGLALLLFSCGNKSMQEPLELNNGEKWTVIESMIVYIRAMEKDVATFESSPEKDYPMLAEKLQKNVDLLISNCTMSGKAHNELHKWLMPNIEQVKTLSNAKDEAESAEIFKKIQNSFISFNQYFQ